VLLLLGVGNEWGGFAIGHARSWQTYRWDYKPNVVPVWRTICCSQNRLLLPWWVKTKHIVMGWRETVSEGTLGLVRQVRQFKFLTVCKNNSSQWCKPFILTVGFVEWFERHQNNQKWIAWYFESEINVYSMNVEGSVE
jgi:hypothetical protein